MAGQDPAKARTKRLRVQRAGELERGRRVVRRISGLELVEVPQPLLREGERGMARVGTRLDFQGRVGGHVLFGRSKIGGGRGAVRRLAQRGRS